MDETPTALSTDPAAPSLPALPASLLTPLPSTPTPPLRTKLRRALRGHWLPAILLALVLGAAGGYLGYRAVRPVYRGVSVVRLDVPAARGIADLDLVTQT